jgi:hypothetical protein
MLHLITLKNIPHQVGLLWTRDILPQTDLLGNIQYSSMADRHGVTDFEPAVPATELSQNHVLDNVATVIR